MSAQLPVPRHGSDASAASGQCGLSGRLDARSIGGRHARARGLVAPRVTRPFARSRAGITVMKLGVSLPLAAACMVASYGAHTCEERV